MRERLNNFDIRLEILKECKRKFELFEIKTNLPDSLTESRVYSYDNLKNTPQLTSTFKEAIFTARELLDLVIHKLAYENKGVISNDFTKFIMGLANNRYLKIDNECIKYLAKPNIIRGLIMIRIIRNKMKKELNLTFHCIDKKDLEITLNVNLPEKIRNGISNFDEIMNIKNKDLIAESTTIKKIDYQLFPISLIKDLINIFENMKSLCHNK